MNEDRIAELQAHIARLQAELDTLLPVRVLCLPDHKAPSWNRLWAGQHFSERRRIKGDAQQLMRVALSDAGMVPGAYVRTPVHLVYTQVSQRPLDADNLLSKPYTDALVTHGILRDDNHKVVSAVTHRSVKGKRDELSLEIRSVA